MSKVSVAVPSRCEPFLNRTVQDLLAKARGDVEVIVLLDGWWPAIPLPEDPRLVVLHWTEPHHLRPSLNAAAQVARGDYFMKIDAHCAVSEGYDVELASTCGPEDLVVPSKFSLDAENWTPHKEPWNYFYLTYPWGLDVFPSGLHDKNLPGSYNRAHQEPVGETLSFQGSCWFLPLSLYRRWGGMDHAFYYYAQEPQELGLKAWLGGGRCLVNKQAWYAHLHKGVSNRRGFPRYKKPWNTAIEQSGRYWMGDQWPQATRKFRWLVERFWPILRTAECGAWPDDWEDPKWEALKRS